MHDSDPLAGPDGAFGDPSAEPRVDATRRVVRAWRRWGVRALDVVLPPRCLSCGTTVDLPGALCPTCWGRLSFITPPQCARCGVPFESAEESAESAICGACSAHPPAYDRARAVWAYDDGSKHLVLAFKHADATHAAPAFGRFLARAGAEVLAEADVLAPVPLHRWRLFQRRYNQAALLGHMLMRDPVLTPRAAYVPDLLVRRKSTVSLGKLGREARRRVVRRAFDVRPAHLPLIRDRRVLLLDDVLTTGATVEECARTLRRAGARAVDVLTLARVVRSAAPRMAGLQGRGV